MEEVEEAEIPSHKSMKMFFLQNPAHKHHLPNKQIQGKMQHLEAGGQQRHLRRVADGEASGVDRGRLSPLWCQHLFARPQGADLTFTGRQLVCFEMIGSNLLSFEAAYL